MTGYAGFGGADSGDGSYDRRKLNRVRNLIIALIALVAIILLIVTFSRPAGASTSARGYIEKTYTRVPSADVNRIRAYDANVDPSAAQSAISRAQRPTDTRQASDSYSGLSPAEATTGTFLQYRDYIVAIFPVAGSSNRSRVTISDDYRSGYGYYGGYIGRYWTPRPATGGTGSDFRGGGSGAGK
jgi:hypothetical protein